MASIFLANDTHDIETIKEKCISYTKLSIKNDIENIDIKKEIE